jgi:hypothetical protein
MNPDTITTDNTTYADANTEAVMKDRGIELLCQENWSLVEERDSSWMENRTLLLDKGRLVACQESLLQENSDLKERILKMNPDTIAADNTAYADANANTVMKDREMALLCKENRSLVEERDSSRMENRTLLLDNAKLLAHQESLFQENADLEECLQLAKRASSKRMQTSKDVSSSPSMRAIYIIKYEISKTAILRCILLHRLDCI